MQTDTYRELFYDKQNELLKALQKAIELQEFIKGYEMALEEVFKAYPQDIFPDTNQGERDDVIERYPGFIDRTSAMMGRHIAKVIRERAFHFANEIHEEQSGGRTLLALDVGQIGANVKSEIPYGALAMWSLDFIRAVRERPLLAKILFRVCIGKYAYREFIGMMDAFQYVGFSPYFDYDLDGISYHKDKIPFINWWTEREGL